MCLTEGRGPASEGNLPSLLVKVTSLIGETQDTTGSFPDWIASFIRRVIQLLENLPEEGPSGSAGGASEGELALG
jgi:hypothetical protein